MNVVKYIHVECLQEVFGKLAVAAVLPDVSRLYVNTEIETTHVRRHTGRKLAPGSREGL